MKRLIAATLLLSCTALADAERTAFTIAFEKDADVSPYVVCERTGPAALHCIDLGDFLAAMELEKAHAHERQLKAQNLDAQWRGVDL